MATRFANKVPSGCSDLLQGLNNKDEKLLESILLNQDKVLIKDIVSEIPLTSLPELIILLHNMLEGNTIVASAACDWLLEITDQRSQDEEISALLDSLDETIDSRLSSINEPAIVSLLGTLDHITNVLKISAVKCSTQNQSNNAVYEEYESSEDGESLRLDEESESEDKWEEFSDEEMDVED